MEDMDDSYPEYYSSPPDETHAPCNNGVVREFSRVFVPTLYSLVFITGLIGNGLVVCVLKRQKTMTMTDVCLLNLSLSDLIFVFTLPFWARYFAVDDWEFGDFMCKAIFLLYLTSFYGNIFFMVMMSVERYLIIVHSVAMSRHRSNVGIVIVVLTWVLSVGAALPTAVFAKEKREESGLQCKPEFPQDSNWRLISNFEMNISGLIIPLFVMIFCYSQTIPTLMNIKTNKKHKAIKLLLLIIIIFSLFWTPFHIVLFLDSLRNLGFLSSCDEGKNVNLSFEWTRTLAFSHCCLNPFIYAFAGQKFKRLVIKLLQTWFSVCSASNHGTPFTSEVSERRSSVHSRSSEITSARLL